MNDRESILLFGFLDSECYSESIATESAKLPIQRRPSGAMPAREFRPLAGSTTTEETSSDDESSSSAVELHCGCLTLGVVVGVILVIALGQTGTLDGTPALRKNGAMPATSSSASSAMNDYHSHGSPHGVHGGGSGGGHHGHHGHTGGHSRDHSVAPPAESDTIDIENALETGTNTDDSTEALLRRIDAWMLKRVQLSSRTNELSHLLKTFDNPASLRRDTYDNALAAIYFTMRGRLKEAKDILDFSIQQMYSYKARGVRIDASGLPSVSRKFALLVASYGDNGKYDLAVDVGNNAWMGIAFARYAAATQNTCYALVASDILEAIDSARGCSDEMGGFMQRLRGSPKNDRSTEHNIDMKAFGRMLHNEKVQHSAEKFIEHVYAAYEGDKGKYLIGTEDGDECVSQLSYDTPFIADTTFWNVAADGDVRHPQHMATALMSALKEVDETDEYLGQKYHGVKFTGNGRGVQWEVTGSAVIAMAHFLNTYPKEVDAVPGLRKLLKERVEAYRESIKRLVRKDGFVRGSVLSKGSDTGMGWKYPFHAHLAATAWAGMMLIHQSSASMPVNEAGNPYAVPPNAISADAAVHAVDKRCIRAESRS